MKPSEILKKVFDLLPFNGSKLKLGSLFAIVGIIAQAFPGVNFVLIIQQILANPTKAGIIAVVVGLIHKVLKAKFPEANY